MAGLAPCDEMLDPDLLAEEEEAEACTFEEPLKPDFEEPVKTSLDDFPEPIKFQEPVKLRPSEVPEPVKFEEPVKPRPSELPEPVKFEEPVKLRPSEIPEPSKFEEPAKPRQDEVPEPAKFEEPLKAPAAVLPEPRKKGRRRSKESGSVPCAKTRTAPGRDNADEDDLKKPLSPSRATDVHAGKRTDKSAFAIRRPRPLLAALLAGAAGAAAALLLWASAPPSAQVPVPLASGGTSAGATAPAPAAEAVAGVSASASAFVETAVGATLGEASSSVPREQRSLLAFNEAVEGVSGLARRLDALEPVLALTASGTELPQASAAVRGRFEMLAQARSFRQRLVELLAALGTASRAGADVLQAAEDEQVYAFHRELALFVANVERRLGITGPVPPRPPSAKPPPPSPAGASGRPAAPAPSATLFAGSQQEEDMRAEAETSRRVRDAMHTIVEGMKRFEAFQPRLRGQPAAVLREIAFRGKRLDEELFALQARGVELEAEGSSARSSMVEALSFAADLEAFATEQDAFMQEVEAAVALTV
eukprot:TRINITY_DN2015_c1_g1_i2.p1 TRINITY_DN2015_c1_g1~~TRINITY_DN2015_c1_g1_i2.p1  ORF type:complete len:535 (+),score=136.50 TRINITY_DN2015_c1_g1_i2:150-1754(+)